MKKCVCHKTVSATLLVWVLLVLCGSTNRAQNNPTNQTATESIRGQAVNGIYADVSVVYREHTERPPTICVSVFTTNEHGFYGELDYGASPGDIAAVLFSDKLLYFKPTNHFCGPIELRDSADRRLPLLKRDVSLSEKYPASFSLSVARKHNPYRPRMFPEPLAARQGNLAEFEPRQYFEIRDSGEYRLAAWPKIYKRSATNSDICERIDLPPVTATFQWRGQKPK